MDDKQLIVLRLSNTDKALAKEIAKQECRSLANWIVSLINEKLENRKKEHENPNNQKHAK